MSAFPVVYHAFLVPVIPINVRAHGHITQLENNVGLLGEAGGCFTNGLLALQNNLVKIYKARNHINGVNFKLILCIYAQSMALGIRKKFQLEIIIRNMISAMHNFWENIFESSWNVSETNPCFKLSYAWMPAENR